MATRAPGRMAPASRKQIAGRGSVPDGCAMRRRARASGVPRASQESTSQAPSPSRAKSKPTGADQAKEQGNGEDAAQDRIARECTRRHSPGLDKAATRAAASAHSSLTRRASNGGRRRASHRYRPVPSTTLSAEPPCDIANLRGRQEARTSVRQHLIPRPRPRPKVRGRKRRAESLGRRQMRVSASQTQI